MTAAPGNIEFFTASALRGLGRHRRALAIERRRLLERAAPRVQLEIRDGAREQAHARVLLCHRIERRQEAGFLREIARIARPAFGERSAGEHADTAGAVHRGDPSDAGRAARGIDVLHMMAERAVVNHVVEGDGAVFAAAQATLLLVRRYVGQSASRRSREPGRRSNGAGDR